MSGDLIVEFAECIIRKLLRGDLGFGGHVYCENCHTNGFTDESKLWTPGSVWPIGVVKHEPDCVVGKAEKVLLKGTESANDK